jgi:hypothetical protein
VSFSDERVELAYQILELTRKLRLIGWDPKQVEELGAELEKRERRLREIDE